MKNPEVIILLASYNRAHLIIETLNSIKNQTLGNFVCLITDDNSTDNTAEVVSGFCEDDSRFLFFKKPKNYPQGLSATRNFGLDLSKDYRAKYLQFFDDDDIMHPEKLEKQVNSIVDENTDLSLCGIKNFKDSYLINTEPYVFTEVSTFYEDYLEGKIVFGGLIPLFKIDYLGNHRFDQRLFYAEEWELFTRIFFKKNPKVSYVPQVLFYRRKHLDSITEGPDKNYNVKKTKNVVRYILNDYLTINKLHTNRSVIFFGNTFLFEFYETNIINDLITYSRNNKISKGTLRYLLAVRKSLKLMRRIFFKMSNGIK